MNFMWYGRVIRKINQERGREEELERVVSLPRVARDGYILKCNIYEGDEGSERNVSCRKKTLTQKPQRSFMNTKNSLHN